MAQVLVSLVYICGNFSAPVFCTVDSQCVLFKFYTFEKGSIAISRAILSLIIVKNVNKSVLGRLRSKSGDSKHNSLELLNSQSTAHTLEASPTICVV